ncbi:MAG: hypothetical protein ABSE62_05050 [Chthoniobacteraceae bacterium]|jgi:hypothetical protein
MPYGTGPFANDNSVNARTLQDLNLQLSIALPAAGASATSAILDTASVNPGRLYDVELFINLPATPALVNTYTITLQLQDSADGITFGNTINAPVVTVAGTLTPGGLAQYAQFAVPIGIGRYLQLVATASASAGSNIAVSATFGFIF